MTSKSLRKCQSGNDKRKKKLREEEVTKKFKGLMDKFVTSTSKNSTNDDETTANDECVNVNTDATNEVVGQEQEEIVNNETSLDQDEGQPFENFDPDPSTWKLPNQDLVDFLVRKGPVRVDMKDDDYPKTMDNNSKQNRRFQNKNYTRRMSNGEKHDRTWLVYSKSVDRVFCFCCKLFKGTICEHQYHLDSVGLNDWHNIAMRLQRHERSREHMLCMSRWQDLEIGLKRGKTIDKRAQDLIMKERERLKQVIYRIICFIKFLAKNDLAFRGSNERIYTENNGNFLGVIECAAQFDYVLEEHIRRIKNKEIRHHYLSHKIQNEFIEMVAMEARGVIIKKIKMAKYYSVLLDCTPDVSHEEQLTLLIRCVNVDDSPPKVEEYFPTNFEG